jgi:sigma-B regulation protein RsbU (phosphoserine phosphatase)
MKERFFPLFPDGRRGVSIAAKLALMIVAGVGAVFLAIVFYGYSTSREALEEEFQGRMENLGRAAESQFLQIPMVAEAVTRDLATMITLFEPPPEKMPEMMKELLASHSQVTGLYVGFSKQATNPLFRNFCPLVFRQGNSIQYKNLAGEMDWTVQDWYQLPLQMGKPLWTEPFFADERAESMMISYGIPLYDANWRYLASIGASLELHWLADIISTMEVGGHGYVFLVTSNGAFVSHPRRELLMRETLFTVAETENRPDLIPLGHKMIQGEKGVASLYDPLRGDLLVFFRPVGNIGWSLGIVFPEEEVLDDIIHLRRVQTFLGLGGVFAMLLMVFFISNRISGPIRKLKDATMLLASGNLHAPLPPVTGRDEVALLTGSFASMRENLLLHLERLKTETAARERIASELDIARSIQMSLVPRTFPPFPKDGRIDLFAKLEPAREVGGDFYDFFHTDEDHLLLVVGDVSGKGIPAALFMAVTRSFVKALAISSGSCVPPGELMAAVNDRIAEGNDACMFVTLCFVLVDLRNGSFSYACGGHPFPRLLGGDAAMPLAPVKGPLVGAMEGMIFEEGGGRLNEGEGIFLFTDGVTEAFDVDESLLSEGLMDQWLGEMRTLGSEALVREMRNRITHFADGAEQSDDITLLCFRYTGGNKKV